MKHIIGFAAFALGISLLFGCRGADVPVNAESTKPDVTIETFKTFAADTEITTEATTAAQTIMTAPPQTELTEPEPEFIEQFEFPEEFYLKMDELIAKYELNIDCDGTIDCSCEPEFEILDEEGNVIEPRKKAVSVYFYDINSGFEYSLNIGAHYPIASTVKIPFCTYIYEKIDIGEIDPEQVLIYEQRHYFEGTGDIVKGDFGQEFTVQQLLTLAITISDNVAYEMLKDLVVWDDFSLYLSDAGCTHEQDIRRSKQKLCCESAGAYGRILAGYLCSGGEHVDVFKTDLLNTRQKMLVSDYPIYRKYGWAGYSFHDIAYVDAPRPYVLAVMSNLENEDNGDVVLFRDISRLIEEYSQTQNSAE